MTAAAPSPNSPLTTMSAVMTPATGTVSVHSSTASSAATCPGQPRR